ncbi:MAG: hypothetical protein A3K65_02415 [Euryarchaeota archaeon RBG_16_68_12]|nr:MAG: hypothetical protein A3K65_02415 [Euryarchaeota archaeon RBG_16_68_12]
MAEDEILAVRARKALYDFVRANPGYHLREIARSTDLSITLADYHLRFLEKHELVSCVMDGEYKRFHPRYAVGDAEARPALSSQEKAALGFLRQPVPLRVVSFLMEREAAQHKDVLAQVPVSASTLTHHLKKLVAGGVLARDPDQRYRVADGRAIARLMVSYDLATPDQVGVFVRVWGEFRL